jgi:hypothetical protein
MAVAPLSTKLKPPWSNIVDDGVAQVSQLKEIGGKDAALSGGQGRIGSLDGLLLHLHHQIRDGRRSGDHGGHDARGLGQTLLHGLMGLDVAPDALGDGEIGGVVLRADDLQACGNPILCLFQGGVDAAEITQGYQLTGVGVDRVRHTPATRRRVEYSQATAAILKFS